MKRPVILNIGSINVDMVVRTQRIPNAGETVFGRDYSYIPGGKGANQGVAAARLGADVLFCGSVGADSFGEMMLDTLKADGVDISLVAVRKDEQTGLAVIPVDDGGENRIIVLSGANRSITRGDIDRAFTHSFDAVMTGFEAPLDSVLYAIELAKDCGIPLILDAGPAVGVIPEQLRGCFIVSPNESECEALCGILPADERAAKAAAELIAREAQCPFVVLKLGARGAYLYERESGRGAIFPAGGAHAVDTTAAGDCFTAALTAEYLRTRDISAAVQYANRAAGICITRKGAIPSLPYERELAD